MVGLIKVSTLFTIKDRDAIKQAIINAEKNTSGEIIPVIATTSGRYDRAEDIFGLLFSLLCVTIGWTLFHDSDSGNNWSDFTFGLPSILLTLFISFIIGVLLAHLFPILRLAFVTRQEMTEETERAAAAAFQKNKLRNTQDSTGILIYISFFEHQVRVLGDDAISSKLTPKDWEHICNIITEGFKKEQYTDGLIKGITLAGTLLSEHFPITAEDQDELANDLVIID